MEQVSVLQCNGCQGHIVVVEQNPYTNAAIWRGVQWWPVPSVGQFDLSVPALISAAYDEAQRCLNANAPNAAAAMLRNVIAQIVIDKGSESAKGKRNLSEKIVQMVKDGGPLGALGDWAVHINLYGNAGAHPEIYGSVTFDEAKDVAALTRTMIELLYEVPAGFARRRYERGH
jgi:hypothetical protein